MLKKWFVIYTLTGNEDRVKKLISTIYPREEVKPLVPSRRLKEIKQGVETVKTRTMFPGYVFIETNLSNELYRSMMRIPSIVKLLKVDSEPVPVPDEEMHPILKLTADSEIIGFSKGIRIGTKVKIIDGPLKSFEGRIISIDARKGRAKVCLDLLGEGKRVDLGLVVLKDIC
ncbi:MAG: antiterminator LoaP [Tepidanaerobacteraceae bacterium]